MQEEVDAKFDQVIDQWLEKLSQRTWPKDVEAYLLCSDFPPQDSSLKIKDFFIHPLLYSTWMQEFEVSALAHSKSKKQAPN